MSEPIYRRIEHGKRVRYELIGNAQHWTSDMDVLKPGQFRLEFASGDGVRRYAYPVSPDVAGWEAAALIARHAMEVEIKRASQCSPDIGAFNPYTKKQMAIKHAYSLGLRFMEDEMREKAADARSDLGLKS